MKMKSYRFENNENDELPISVHFRHFDWKNEYSGSFTAIVTQRDDTLEIEGRINASRGFWVQFPPGTPPLIRKSVSWRARQLWFGGRAK